jgi:uncharacterized protein YqgV (UPF0045/DUF77 family)
MTIQAEVSLYVLRTDTVGLAVESFVGDLADHDLEVEPGPMSTRLRGDCAEIFAALAKAFAAVAGRCQTVLIVKASNACPSTLE